jgi:VWFA-related protein
MYNNKSTQYINKKKSLLFFIFLLLAYFLLVSQAYAIKRFSPQILHIDLSLFPRAKIFISVTDIHNAPIVGLDKTNIQITSDGRLIENFTFLPVNKSKEDTAIVLGIDTSGTMKGKPLENAKNAVSEFISRLAPNDKATILTFNSDVNIVSGFTSDKEELYKAVHGIKIAGKLTKLYDAMFEAIRLTSLAGLPSRRVLIFLSDGKDEGSSATLEDCIKQAVDNNLQVYTIGYESILQSVGKNYFKYLERIAKLTHSVFFKAPKTSNLSGFYRDIGFHLQSQYLLSIKDINIATDGKTHNLQIVFSDIGITSTVDKKYLAPWIETKPLMQSQGNKALSLNIIIAVGFGILVIIIVLILFVQKRKQHQELPKNEIEPQAPAKEIIEEVEKQLCPVCHRVMADDWSECLFCKKEHETKDPVVVVPVSYNESQPPPMNFGKLVVNNGAHQGHTYPVKHHRTNLGAVSGNDIIVCEDPLISSNHCRIKFENQKMVIIDLDSTNGTFVNGRRVESIDLHHHDIIRLGNTELLYHRENQ